MLTAARRNLPLELLPLKSVAYEHVTLHVYYTSTATHYPEQSP